ncbi:NAD-dependent epimerase/dehydratase family protein [Chelativorans xinjiangense]|uniref:NAD-dependent epimerase/dehydratase family protein n=1 Tax=Chelativorans xinjiangense TaxID=2681485 RepID=UPI001356AAF0|nr:NAD-dependent epimerase/dehydratase family protein [Chelativorans xinjiangense]
MAKYVVVGAGPVGCETARLLAERGDDVRLISRSGTGLAHSRVHAVALDARDADAIARASQGAEVLFMCAMAPYHQWPAEFPPIMEGVARAAERVGARIVVAGNTYGYGEGAPSQLSHDLPLKPTTVKGRVRVAMWERALSSSVPALEVRASDYLGKGAVSLFTLAVVPHVLAGEEAAIPGNPNAVHPWSFTKDVARTLVAASSYSGEWNRAFHVPSQHATPRELAARFATLVGAPTPRLREFSEPELRSLAENDPVMREVEEMVYLLEESSVLDASETTRLLGIVASALDDMVSDTLRLS